MGGTCRLCIPIPHRCDPNLRTSLGSSHRSRNISCRATRGTTVACRYASVACVVWCGRSRVQCCLRTRRRASCRKTSADRHVDDCDGHRHDHLGAVDKNPLSATLESCPATAMRNHRRGGVDLRSAAGESPRGRRPRSESPRLEVRLLVPHAAVGGGVRRACVVLDRGLHVRSQYRRRR